MLQLLYDPSSVFWSVNVTLGGKGGPKVTFTLSHPESWFWPVDYRKKKSKVPAWHVRLLGHLWDPKTSNV